MKFRKRPIVIDAIRYTGKIEDLDGLMLKIDGQQQPYYMTPEMAGLNAAHEPGKPLYIPTAEGVLTVQVGDFVIRGLKGELYPCKPDIFSSTYERAEDEDHDSSSVSS